MKPKDHLFLAVLLTAVFLGCAAPAPPPAPSFPVLTGPYLGQTPPGEEPELFAPGIVTTGLFTRDVTMTPDGGEIYFSVALGTRYDYSAILVTKLVDGRWSEPEVTPFAGSPRYGELEPFVSPDGTQLFYISDRPQDGGDGEPGDKTDIWVVDRQGDGWGEPRNLGEPVSSDAAEYFPSLTQGGTIYFTREGPGTNAIYRARRTEDGYAEPEKLPEQINSDRPCYNASIAPDESYLILPIYGRDDSLGATDYYVVFRDADDNWSEPVHMGPKVNSANGLEYSGYVSPDGKYFFFMSGRTVPGEAGERFTWAVLRRMHDEPRNGNSDIYWVDASFLEALRPGGGA